MFAIAKAVLKSIFAYVSAYLTAKSVSLCVKLGTKVGCRRVFGAHFQGNRPFWLQHDGLFSGDIYYLLPHGN